MVTQRLNNIQVLRAFAALLVVFAHVNLPRYQSVGIRADMFGFGGFGVDIFFVISGFIMMYVSESKGGIRAAVVFLEHRVFRVWPLYAIFTGVAVWLAYKSNPNWWLQYDYPREKMGARWIFESLTFTHWHRLPVYAIGWTLIYEFWFYVAVAIMISLKIRRRWFFIGYTLLILVLRAVGTGNSMVLNFFSHPLMLEFVFGVLLFEIYASNNIRFSNRLVWILSILTSISCFWAIHVMGSPALYSRAIFSGFAAFCVVGLGLVLEGHLRPWKVLIFFGDASYSLYLAHWLVVTTFPSLLDLYNCAGMGPVPFIALNVIISIFLSIIVFYSLEKPLRWLATRLQRRLDPKTLGTA